MARKTWWPSPYGPEDQIGMLNEITPNKVMIAAKLVDRGIARSGCDTWSFGPVPPEDPRQPFMVPQMLNFVLTHARVRGATGAWVSPVAIV